MLTKGISNSTATYSFNLFPLTSPLSALSPHLAENTSSCFRRINTRFRQKVRVILVPPLSFLPLRLTYIHLPLSSSSPSGITHLVKLTPLELILQSSYLSDMVSPSSLKCLCTKVNKRYRSAVFSPQRRITHWTRGEYWTQGTSNLQPAEILPRGGAVKIILARNVC